jgi:2-methylcitrate dehydratase PrpD
MKNFVKKFAEFIKCLEFDDLPDYVLHEMKRVILDSIGLAFAGHSTERGKIASELAIRLNGPPESSIIGTSDKVSCVNAAFANGELMNALDFDPVSSKGGHDVPTLVSAIFAVAESIEASGKDFILATALGIEISQRLRLATKGIRISGYRDAKVLWPDVLGYSTSALGAAAGGGKCLNLNEEQISNAIGIAGYICPPSTFMKFVDTAPIRTTKYGFLGWGAKAGVTAALLAEMGYTGDIDLFNGEYSFWRFIGKEKNEWNMEDITQDLGNNWLCHEIQYKQYPCGL